MDDHPSFEDLSAFHDGEAPEWAEHVGACPDCRRQLDALAALSAAVGAVGDRATLAPTADDPVARAVASTPAPAEPGDVETDTVPDIGGPTAAPTWWRTRTAMAAFAAAAVVVVAVGFAAAIGRSSDKETTATGAAADRQYARPETAAPSAGAAARLGDDSAVVGGDLGEVPDTATLLARVGPELKTAGGPSVVSGGAPAAPAVPSSSAGTKAVPDPDVVGTRPCEAEARQQEGSALGEVIYVATATSRGVPAVVLAFAPASGTGPVTVEVLAQAGCSPLLRASTP